MDLMKTFRKYGEIDEKLSDNFSSTLNQEMPDEDIITYSIK
jgi:hypothetical protein